MLTGKTKTGFKFEVDEDIRDDMELLEGIALMAGGDMSAMPTVLISMFGKEQKMKLYDHCRNKNGRVSSKRVMEELQSIFDEIGKKDSDVKN